jgi:hypothetical protein
VGNRWVVSLRHAQTVEEEYVMGLTLHERVALKRDLQEHRLRAGDEAYLVDFVPHPESGEEGGVIEVFNAIGDSIAVVTVPLSELEPLAGDDVLAVRRRNASGDAHA